MVELKVGSDVYKIESEKDIDELKEVLVGEGLIGQPLICPVCNRHHKIGTVKNGFIFDCPATCVFGCSVFQTKAQAVKSLKVLIAHSSRRATPRRTYTAGDSVKLPDVPLIQTSFETPVTPTMLKERSESRNKIKPNKSNESRTRRKPSNSNESKDISKPKTQNESEIKRIPDTANESNGVSKPIVANESNRAINPDESNESKDISKPKTLNESSNNSKPILSNESTYKSNSRKINESIQASKPKSNNESKGTSKPRSQNESIKASKPKVSNGPIELSKPKISNAPEGKRKPKTNSAPKKRKEYSSPVKKTMQFLVTEGYGPKEAAIFMNQKNLLTLQGKKWDAKKVLKYANYHKLGRMENV